MHQVYRIIQRAIVRRNSLHIFLPGSTINIIFSWTRNNCSWLQCVPNYIYKGGKNLYAQYHKFEYLCHMDTHQEKQLHAEAGPGCDWLQNPSPAHAEASQDRPFAVYQDCHGMAERTSDNSLLLWIPKMLLKTCNQLNPLLPMFCSTAQVPIPCRVSHSSVKSQKHCKNYQWF